MIEPAVRVEDAARRILQRSDAILLLAVCHVHAPRSAKQRVCHIYPCRIQLALVLLFMHYLLYFSTPLTMRGIGEVLVLTLNCDGALPLLHIII